MKDATITSKNIILYTVAMALVCQPLPDVDAGVARHVTTLAVGSVTKPLAILEIPLVAVAIRIPG